MTPSMILLESRTLLSADYVASVTVTPGVYLRGEVVPITVHLTNRGTSGTIFPSQHTVVLSLDKVYGNQDDIVGWAGFSTPQGLARGQVVNRAFNPSIRSHYPSGNYYIAIKADVQNTVNESDESNVFFTKEPVVNVPSNDLPASIAGTAGNDRILITQKLGQLIVTVNGVARASAVRAHLFIDAGAGNDLVAADPSVTTRLQVTGNVGSDTLGGGSGNDELSGSFGIDRVLGGAGDDLILGGALSDYLNGEAGNDEMIAGGGNDRMIDTVGRDYFIAGLGNDFIIARDTTNTASHGPDTISGHGGLDTAQVDTGAFADAHTSIEVLLP